MYTPDESFLPAEVVGEWFTIKKPYPSSPITHIYLLMKITMVQRETLL